MAWDNREHVCNEYCIQKHGVLFLSEAFAVFDKDENIRLE